MHVIQNQADVRYLKDTGIIKAEMAETLLAFLDELEAELESMSPGTFRIEDQMQIVLLDVGDNARDLSDVGLNLEDQGLLGCIPEWFESIKLDGIKFYRFMVLYNDSFGTIFYAPVGIFDAEVEGWLAANLVKYSAS